MNDATNKREAQGILTAEGIGATGQSGSSCARNIKGAFWYGEYAEGRNRMYIIDSRKLGADQYAYDMSEIVTKNYPDREDETGFEVNCTEIPMKAILGYVEYSTGLKYIPPKYIKNEFG